MCDGGQSDRKRDEKHVWRENSMCDVLARGTTKKGTTRPYVYWGLGLQMLRAFLHTRKSLGISRQNHGPASGSSFPGKGIP